MSGKERLRTLIVGMALFLAMLACDLPSGASTATPTAAPTAAAPAPNNGQGGSNSTGGNSGGNSGGSQGGGNNAGSNSGGNTGSTVEPTSTLQPDVQPLPYVVKQIETLGKETISGFVCSLSQPFTVQAVAPEASWAFVFVPLSAQKGNVSYAYSIPSAGESHQATGTYTIARLDSAGTLQLSLQVSDHVVFKGFDGNIPVRYKFNLVPSSETPCKPPA